MSLRDFKPKLIALAKKVRKEEGDIPGLKYIEKWNHFESEKDEIVRLCGLDKSTGKRVLDIGTGMGFLAKKIMDLGHKVLTTDCELPIDHNHSLYRRSRDMLNVECIDDAVKAYIPMKIPGKFDVIVASRTVFDRGSDETDGRHWKIKEWKYWLNDVANHLTDEGFVYLKPNSVLSGIPSEMHNFILKQANSTKAVSLKITKMDILKNF